MWLSIFAIQVGQDIDSMNIAISKITTDYYLIQGLDDRIIYENFRSFLKFLDRNRVDLLFAGVIKAKKKLLYLYTKRRDILLVQYLL